MIRMNQTNKSVIQNLVIILVLICGIILSFVFFRRSNVARIKRQNENYIADIATQRASLIDDLFDENLSYIESSAIVLETAFQNQAIDLSKLNVEQDEQIDPVEMEKLAETLKQYEDRFAFSYLRFIDLYGRDYTTGETVIAANVSERNYFKDGIQGGIGITYILSSKVTSERQIGFYCPVYQGGEIAGLVVGFYGEAFIRELLALSVFDYECNVQL